MPACDFCWYELMTSDKPGAEAFYREVVGWKTAPPAPGMEFYTIVSAGEHGIGGIMAFPPELPEAARHPHWTGYIAVPDVDSYAPRIAALGGKVLRPASDIPDIGRFAVVADPQGAPFVLFQPKAGMEPPPAPPQGTPGHVSWHELMASDWEAVFPFYAELFGWTKDMAVDCGPMGIYQLFAKDGQAIGAMMTKPKEVPAPFWSYYVQVDGIDAAIARINRAGGTVVNGPHEVPGGSWIVQALDPQGAFFALVSCKR